MAWSWSKRNIVVVNPEWWPSSSWDWALQQADLLVYKSMYARTRFPEVDEKRVRILSWRTSLQHTPTPSFQKACLYLLGKSVNKHKVAHIVCSAWKPSWPPLLVVATSPLPTSLSGTYSSNVQFRPPFPTDAERIAVQGTFGYHVIASAAEGFGYTFSECATMGAIPIWNSLPVFQEAWGDVLGSVGRIASHALPESEYRDVFHTFEKEDVETAVESILHLTDTEETNLRRALQQRSVQRTKEFRTQWKSILHHMNKSNVPYPIPLPQIPIPELPDIAIVTLTRNRPRWFANMAKNILTCSYPFDKLTWVLVDDSESEGRVDKDIMKFQATNPQIRVRYVSCPKPMTIGAKRNKACSSSPDNATVFVMMDDDDHYPPSSVMTRLSWLRATKAECVYCSTLPMYDCKNYISAMNVPPLHLSPTERVSEATLTFTRSFWEQGPFPDSVQIGEGEGFLKGRIEKTAEISPEGVIVSFLHGKNATSRRVPESTEPNGCHYGFDDTFFSYLSGLA